jgi:hypothetical protein
MPRPKAVKFSGKAKTRKPRAPRAKKPRSGGGKTSQAWRAYVGYKPSNAPIPD